MDDFPGIPGCKILKELGQGSVAKVYLGIQENLNREVAIKILEPSLLKDKSTTKRFKKGAKIAASLSHSNIIQIFDRGKHKNYHYIIMEYLEQSLKDRITHYPQGKMPPEIALEIIKDIFKALDYAHLKGIYHRDIKPENIMFKQDNTPILLDFGIARVLDSSDTQTASGSLMGTAYYMSPEQCRTKQVDGQSDIYSLGVLLYEMLTGKKPYKEKSVISLALQHIEAPIPKLPKALNLYQPLINKMMAKDREARIASYPEFQQLVGEILNEPIIPPSPPQSSQPPQPPSNIKKAFLLFKKLVLDIKSSCKKLLSLTREKLISFSRDIKDKTGSLKKQMGEKLKPTMKNKKEKWLFNILLMGLISVIIFILGSYMINSLYPPTSSNELLKQGDPESLKKAMALVNDLKKIEITPEAKEMEEKSTNILEPGSIFDKYLTDIEKNIKLKNFSTAKRLISKAKTIKSSPALEALESICTDHIELQNKMQKLQKLEEEKNDHQAYITALSQNTVGAYEGYLKKFPGGIHKDKATLQINELKKKVPPPKTIKFRTQEKVLDKDQVNSTIIQYNFFEKNRNRNGAFKSHYKREIKMGVPVVIDQTTGLMWYDGEPSREFTFKKTIDCIQNLNRKNPAGYNDWRLPTLEEAASLLRKKKNSKNGLHIDPIFAGNQKRIWTKDSYTGDEGKEKWWVVLINFGTIYRYPNGTEHHVRPVRSLK